MRSRLNNSASPITAPQGLRLLARAQSKIQNRKSKIARGFTLVELLVAITILVILTTLVLAAFQKDDGDRLSASARRLQAFAEGARSRAIRDKQVRGFRLITSARDPRVVDSIAYVGATDYLEGLVNVAWYAPAQKWLIQDTSGVWTRLMPTRWNPAPGPDPNLTGRNLIRTGGRIEIPAGTGKWYTIHLLEEDVDRDLVLDPDEDLNGNNTWDPVPNTLALSGQFEPSAWNAVLGAFIPSTNTLISPAPAMQPLITTAWPIASNIPYRMELAPALLPNTDPLTFERGVVIDLDASQIPWRPSGNPPRYPQIMEVLFDGRGNPIGDAAATLVHLYLTNVADVELSRGLPDPVGHPANPPFTPNYPFATATPKLLPVVLTVYSQTGQVTPSTPNLVSDANGRAVSGLLFNYAQRGQEAK